MIKQQGSLLLFDAPRALVRVLKSIAATDYKRARAEIINRYSAEKSTRSLGEQPASEEVARQSAAAVAPTLPENGGPT